MLPISGNGQWMTRKLYLEAISASLFVLTFQLHCGAINATQVSTMYLLDIVSVKVYVADGLDA